VGKRRVQTVGDFGLRIELALQTTTPAASCVSLFGDGTSLAMIGASTLADSLTGDIPIGLRTYEAGHRPQRAAKENSVAYATRLLILATSDGIAVRNLAIRLMPLAVRIRETVFHKAIPG
jgi:2-polyprenyl-6-methoxyphenol hydroxylase-like FAD-dependent oxidoreductase